MHNLQGIIAKSVNNASMQMEKLGYLATNTANYNTSGFKGVCFENYLKEDGRLEGAIRTDYSVGSIIRTGNELDVGLSGPGFIPVTKMDGTVAYTRDGSFKINKDGMLSTNDGAIVGDGIQVPENHYRLTIKPDGTVTVMGEIDQVEKKLGKIPIVNFNCPEGLKSTEGNKLLATSESGPPMLNKDHGYIQQGGLERSNVDLQGTINEILKLNASMIASTRIVKVVDEIYRQSINLKQ